MTYIHTTHINTNHNNTNMFIRHTQLSVWYWFSQIVHWHYLKTTVVQWIKETDNVFHSGHYSIYMHNYSIFSFPYLFCWYLNRGLSVRFVNLCVKHINTWVKKKSFRTDCIIIVNLVPTVWSRTPSIYNLKFPKVSLETDNEDNNDNFEGK